MEAHNYQKNILQKGERYVRTHFFCKTNLDALEVKAQSGNETPAIKSKGKEGVHREEKISEIIPTNFISIMSMATWGGRETSEINKFLLKETFLASSNGNSLTTCYL